MPCCPLINRFLENPCVKKMMIYVQFILALWTVGDMVLDWYSAYSYYDQYQRGDLTSDLYWKCGLICIFTPNILSLMWWLSNYCTGRKEFSWCGLGVTCLWSLFYPLVVIVMSILTAYRNITGKDDEYDTETKQAKLMEVIGEAIPQAAISITFIANHGGPTDHPINTLSALFSLGSIGYGVVTGIKAFRYEYCVMKSALY